MDVPALPGLDLLVLAVPFLVMLFMAMAGLDERVANRGRRTAMRRFFCEADDQSVSFLSDPDGKLWLPVADRSSGKKLAQSGLPG